MRRPTSLLAIALVAAPLVAGCSGSSSSPTTSEGPRGSGCPTSAPTPMAAGETATVTIKTAKGDIVVKVDGSAGPLAAANFVALARCGFYNGVVFHRLVPTFVIQGGDPTGTGTGGPGYEFKDDPVASSSLYTRGTVAMANSGSNTNGSQFFICLDDLSDTLEPKYSIFGHVTSGMDVVDTIAAMPNSGSPNNTAKEPVAMTSVTVTTP
jgi:cyclophilin family peptidyl-prolyl cis-trans isomerase